MNPLQLSCVLFDVDGTLVDTTDLIVEGLGSTLETRLGRRPPREQLVALIGRPLVEQLREYVAEADVPRLAERFMEFYEAHRARLERPFPGAIEMLEEARRQGMAVGLVTSKNRREIEGTLEHLPVRDLLDFYICSEDTARPKPAPDPVLEALRRAEAAPRETLFVGDSVYDMRSGRDAGVVTGAALWGPFGRAILEKEQPDCMFEAPSDVAATIVGAAIRPERPAPSAR